MDLSLVSLEDLLKEAESRCSCFVCAYELPKESGKVMQFIYGRDTDKWAEAVKLSSILNNDVLNNWKGEMKTLQKINEENSDE